MRLEELFAVYPSSFEPGSRYKIVSLLTYQADDLHIVAAISLQLFRDEAPVEILEFMGRNGTIAALYQWLISSDWNSGLLGSSLHNGFSVIPLSQI
jgi:hypothetical protein